MATKQIARRPKAPAQRTRLSSEQQQAAQAVKRAAAPIFTPAAAAPAPTPAPVTPAAVAAPAAAGVQMPAQVARDFGRTALPPPPAPEAPTTFTSPGMPMPEQVARDFGRASLPPPPAPEAPMIAAPAVMPQQTTGATRSRTRDVPLFTPSAPAPNMPYAPGLLGLPPQMSPQQEAAIRQLRSQQEAEAMRMQEAAMLAADRQRQQQAQMDLVNRMQPPPPPPAPALQPPPFRPGEGGRGINPDLLAQQAAEGQRVRDMLAQMPQPLVSPQAQAQMDRSRAIQTLYGQVFNREADPGGLAYWMNSGLSPDQIKQQFLNSPEYQERQKLAQAQFGPATTVAAPAPSGIAALAPQAPTQQQMQTGMAPGRGGMGINPALQEVAPEAPSQGGPFGGQAALPTAPANPTPAPQSAPQQPAAATAPSPNMTFGKSMFGNAAMFKAGGLTTKVGTRVQAAAKADMAKASKPNAQKGVGLAKKGLGKFKVR